MFILLILTTNIFISLIQCLKKKQQNDSDSIEINGSAIPINPGCHIAFKQLSDGNLKYIIYKIDEKCHDGNGLPQESEIIVEIAKSAEDLGLDGDDYEGNSKPAYEAFIKDLMAKTNGFNDGRIAVFDFKF
uniref:Uncharacterized protein n=1 Tax=Panagrolaimus sp. ES5 TaxID=591445 RepID=A0AC34GJ73_9BILA